MKDFYNFSALAKSFDGFVIDLWGVIHDGQNPYEGAADCVKKLKSENKKIWFLSNAPRRAARAAEGLQRFGVTRDCYDGIMTSGEMAFSLLTNGKDPRFSGWGKNYLFIGPERDKGLMDESNFTATDVAKAGFVLNVGFDDDILELDHYLPMLAAAAKRKLPMICTNPDRIIVRLDGSPFPCAGLLADEYEKLGGEVHHIGKPFADVYNHCLERMSGNILAVGDNLDTDILGANQLKLPSVLVTGGILRHRMGLDDGKLPSHDALSPLCAEMKAWPDYLLPWFKW